MKSLKMGTVPFAAKMTPDMGTDFEAQTACPPLKCETSQHWVLAPICMKLDNLKSSKQLFKVSLTTKLIGLS